MGDLEGRHPVGPTVREERKAGKVERRNSVRLGIGTVEMVGVDELEKGLVVEELGEGMVRIWVGKFKTRGLPCSGMVEAGESTDRVCYGSSRLLNDNLEKRFVVRSIATLVRGVKEKGAG